MTKSTGGTTVNTRFVRYGIAAAVASAFLPTVHAEQASSDEGQLGEIVVTAERRSESVLSVPLAVSAFTQADVAAMGVTSSRELTGLVPTLQANSAFGDVQPNFSLRGIGVNNEHNPNQASPVGVYLDDAYIAARVSQGLQLFDLDRIEILRGPQGTLYGRNTTGGAINFISHQPSLSGGSSGNFEAGYGSFNTFTAQGAYETTLQEGVSGLRVAFNYAHGDGWNKNVFPGQPDADSTDNAAVRAILKLRPSDQLDVTLKFTGGHSNPTQAGVFNLGVGGVAGKPADYNPVLLTTREGQGLSFWQIDSNRLGYNTVTNFGGELTVKYKLNEQWSLYSLTSYDFANAQFTQEGTGVNSPALAQPLDTLYGNKFTMINQELRVSYLSDRTKFQGGLYYGYDKDDSNSYYWLFDGAVDIHQAFNQYRNSYAIFAQLDQTLTDHLSATLGARYTKDYNTYADYYSYFSPAKLSYTGQRDTSAALWDPAQASAFFLGSSYDPVSHQVLTGPAYHLDSGAPTWRVALDYTFDNGQLAYVSYNRGYRGAAFCGQCFSNTVLDTTKPEYANAYEVGTKGKYLDHRLVVSADAFWIDYSNQQTNEQIGIQSILTNVPKARMRGLEFEAQAQPIPELRAALSFGYLDAKYQQLTLSEAVVNGSREPYAPEFTGSLRVDWRIGSFYGGNVTLTPSVIYASYVYYSPYDNLAGNAPLSQPANTKVNAQLEWASDNRFIRAWAKNIGNVQTYGDGLDLRSFGYYYLVQAPPRTFGVSAGMRF